MLGTQTTKRAMNIRKDTFRYAMAAALPAAFIARVGGPKDPGRIGADSVVVGAAKAIAL